MSHYEEETFRFRGDDFEVNRGYFNEYGRQQHPHSLFIGCSDSRVVPSMITKTIPGELFIIRNIANLVPPYRESSEFLATTSAIEYAVQVLNVKNIIICGHSNCGGCAALWHDHGNTGLMPHTRRWLELASPIKERVTRIMATADLAAREWLTERINIIEQMNHLMTYPYIRERVENNELKIYGWHYMLHSGKIYQYNESAGYFESKDD